MPGLEERAAAPSNQNVSGGVAGWFGWVGGRLVGRELPFCRRTPTISHIIACVQPQVPLFSGVPSEVSQEASLDLRLRQISVSCAARPLRGMAVECARSSPAIILTV